MECHHIRFRCAEPALELLHFRTEPLRIPGHDDQAASRGAVQAVAVVLGAATPSTPGAGAVAARAPAGGAAGGGRVAHLVTGAGAAAALCAVRLLGPEMEWMQ